MYTISFLFRFMNRSYLVTFLITFCFSVYLSSKWFVLLLSCRCILSNSWKKNIKSVRNASCTSSSLSSSQSDSICFYFHPSVVSLCNFFVSRRRGYRPHCPQKHIWLRWFRRRCVTLWNQPNTTYSFVPNQEALSSVSLTANLFLLPFDSWSPKNCQRIFRKRKWSRLALSPFPLTLSLSVSSCRMILSICYPVHKCICVCNIRPLSPFHCRGLVENDTHSNKQYVVILGTEKRRQRCEVGSDAITHTSSINLSVACHFFPRLFSSLSSMQRFASLYPRAVSHALRSLVHCHK